MSYQVPPVVTSDIHCRACALDLSLQRGEGAGVFTQLVIDGQLLFFQSCLFPHFWSSIQWDSAGFRDLRKSSGTSESLQEWRLVETGGWKAGQVTFSWCSAIGQGINVHYLCAELLLRAENCATCHGYTHEQVRNGPWPCGACWRQTAATCPCTSSLLFPGQTGGLRKPVPWGSPRGHLYLLWVADFCPVLCLHLHPSLSRPSHPALKCLPSLIRITW